MVMSKEEFKRRWEKDESGDGITFDDVADCAEDWGLYRTPRIHDIHKVLKAVLKAADVNEEEDDDDKESEVKNLMANKILILGNSGTGKSASLRNFSEDEVAVISCAGKPLPFQNNFEQYVPKFETLVHDIIQAMDKTNKKVIIIDDFQYVLSFPWLRRIKEKGWEKFEDIQSDYFNIIQACDYMADDVTVYFLSHTTTDENGNEKIKTIGKMLDERIQIEGMFTICLKTSVQDGKYYFLTQNSGRDTVKSPMGMFDSYAIDNDLKYVDTRIRNYYRIGEHASDEEVAALAEEVAAPEVEKPDADGKKRRRGRPRKETSTKEVETSTKEVEISTNEEETNEQVKEEAQQEPAEEEKGKEEKPKRRARKVRTESEEVTEDAPKRRTRKKRVEDPLKNAVPIDEDDVPF